MDGSRSLTATLANAPLLNTLGDNLEQVRRDLLSFGHSLRQHAEPAYRSAVDEAIRFLERQSCRVAVIGQVKAGKSSFINALMGRPGLLPSDVNPWTTVVTNLHFYYAAPPAEHARFTFFGNDEWRSIAQGGGPLRELTERLVPGFDPDLLNAQLQSMRLRAEARLGPQMGGLLGQYHDYASIGSDLLARYVSAGAGDDDNEAGPGWYSDITKSADLYFGSERRGFPLTIVDTPGTNDPLLVRDEVTRQSLASAEIYVVVLTAQQPLSIGDMALLRLLRGLHKDRIIIFINRIDGLRDITDASARVVAHVEARLREEFPSTTFPIIVGSAIWANAALLQDATSMGRLLTTTLADYAKTRGIDGLTPPQPGGRLPATTVSSMLTLSGIPAVTAAISQLMTTGSAAYATGQIARFFLQIARTCEKTSEAETKSVSRAIQQMKSGAGQRAAEQRLWSQELAQMEAAARELEANLSLYEQALQSIVERCGDDLRRLLTRNLGEFTEQQIAELTAAYRARSVSVWTCDTGPLRQVLQNNFLRIFRFWENRLEQSNDLMRQQFQAVLTQTTPSNEQPAHPIVGDVSGRSPSVSSLSQVVALDLSASWWKMLWDGRPTLESRVTQLRHLIHGEFQTVIDDLIKEAVSSLKERADYASRQARIGTLDIAHEVHRRSSELVAGLQQAGDVPDPDELARLNGQLQQSEARYAHWRKFATGLSTLTKTCDAWSGQR